MTLPFDVRSVNYQEGVFSLSLSTILKLYGYTVATKKQTFKLIGPTSEYYLDMCIHAYKHTSNLPATDCRLQITIF